LNENRIRLLQKGTSLIGPIVYWMSRDQRLKNNWALNFAIELSQKYQQPIVIIFNLTDDFPGATLRAYSFMLKGLQEQQELANKFNIPFVIKIGKPEINIPNFVYQISASNLISDFDPLKIKRFWKREIAKNIDIPFWEVDAHNIIPAFYVSQKQEYGAYTLRPKINKNLMIFLDEFPELEKQKISLDLNEEMIQPDKILKGLNVDRNVKIVSEFIAGEFYAEQILFDFIENKLSRYNEFHNNPNYNVQSNLSPYLHFGQISSQKIVMEFYKRNLNDKSAKAFLEEIVVRRELSDNYCYYNQNYDNFRGFPAWSQQTLNDHKKDPREYTYNIEDFEQAKTHDKLWNSAQTEMLETGKMHSYLRMYWAKKILEWTTTPETAQQIAIYLNDKYSLDGRDPNGYTGIAWSIGGVHDRAWFERPIFGKIRYMNLNGAAKKFDITQYCNKYNKIE
jgi:deoxyribodipyrimidine photo-lyase